MNYITKIHIVNFQSHQDTTIGPAEDGRLTVIVGPSDSGKTAILRALRWLLFNVPQGTDYIRAGATFARVTIDLSSGHQIIRERTKSKNQYKIIAPGADEQQVFEGFGTDVPLEVQELTGIRPVSIGDMEIIINLAEQLDGPFLGRSVSGPARAKILGKLAGTEEIDYAGKTLGTDLLHRGQDEKRLEAEIQSVEASIAGYEYLPAMATRITDLEMLIDATKAKEERREKLAVIWSELQRVQVLVKESLDAALRWANVGHAEQFADCARDTRDKRGRICGLKASYDNVWEITSDLNLTILRWRDTYLAEKALAQAMEIAFRRRELQNAKPKLIEIDEMIPRYNATIQRTDAIEQAEVLIDSLIHCNDVAHDILVVKRFYDSLSGEIETVITKQTDINQRIVSLEQSYHDELTAAGVCPMCGKATA